MTKMTHQIFDHCLKLFVYSEEHILEYYSKSFSDGEQGELASQRINTLSSWRINSTMFLDPRMRHMQQPDFSDLVHRYSRDEGPVTFSIDTIKMPFNVLKNDSTVDVQFNLQSEDPVKFWCMLFEGCGYKQLFA